MYRALEEKCDLCYLPKISAHILRHTFCLRMCASAVIPKVLQGVVGHRNMRTIARTYVQVFGE